MDREIQSQKSFKSRISDELNVLRSKEIAKSQRDKFKSDGSTFLTPEEAEAYLHEIRMKKKDKPIPKPPTNLQSSDLNDWYSQQRKMHLDEQKKRIEAEKLLRGYRSTLDHLGKGRKSPSRKKKSEYHDAEADITEEAINVSEAVKNFQTSEEVDGVVAYEGSKVAESVESSNQDKIDEVSSEDEEQLSPPSLNDEEVSSETQNEEEDGDVNSEKEDPKEEFKTADKVAENVEENSNVSQERNEEKVESLKEEDNGEEEENASDEQEAKIQIGKSGKEAEDEEEEGESIKAEAQVKKVEPAEGDTKFAGELVNEEAQVENDESANEETEVNEVVKEEGEVEAEPAKEETEVEGEVTETEEIHIKDEEGVIAEDEVSAQEKKNDVEVSVKDEEAGQEKNLQERVLDTQDSIEVSLSNLEKAELKDETAQEDINGKKEEEEKDNLENCSQEKEIDTKDSSPDVQEKQAEDTVTDTEEIWRNMISNEPGAKFSPESNRYHLYVSHACPWAHRTVITVAVKGLEDVIGITYVHPTWQYTKPEMDEHRGWVFGSQDDKFLTSTSGSGSFPVSWGEEDPLMGAKTIREIYEKVNDTTERYILPVLWDKKLNTIVSNESSEIIRMLNFEFNEYASNSDLNLYPDSLAEKIDEINQWIYPTFNNGVYRCGLASTQERYDVAIDELTMAFDKIDSILQNQRFIAGGTFTEADVRLFVTLIRFDEVYDIYFKTNTRSVSGTPAILNYVREIYQMKGVAKTCNMEMIKAHYYTSHVELNKYSIIPRGVDFIGLLDKPHNRESLN